MHPILAQKERFVLYMAAWLLLAGLLAVLATASGSLRWNEAFALTLPMSIVYAFMCLAALYLCRAFPLQQTNFLKLISVYGMAALLSSSVWLLFIKGWVLLLARTELIPSLDLQFHTFVPVILGVGVLLFLLAVVVHYLLLAFESSREVERQALELKALAREAELRALKMQIQPHFLFNSLNSISALTTADPAAARDMSLRLAEFLRKTLKLAGAQMISLQEEIALIEDFLAIEQVRFGPRLNVTKNIDEQSLRTLIPPLLLQPLVENAIKHGIASILDGGTIGFEVHHYGRRLSIAITNPCDPDHQSPVSHGVGLENVSSRLSSVYGSEARLDTKKMRSSFRVELSLPTIV